MLLFYENASAWNTVIGHLALNAFCQQIISIGFLETSGASKDIDAMIQEISFGARVDILGSIWRTTGLIMLQLASYRQSANF